MRSHSSDEVPVVIRAGGQMVMRAVIVVVATACVFGGDGAAEPGFEPLFDGMSLAGWQANGNAATWRVEDGAIVCRGPWSLQA